MMAAGAGAMVERAPVQDAPEPLPPIAPRLLTDLLDHAVSLHASWPAIDFFGRRWSYAELGTLVLRAARGLQDLGVTRGTRIGLCLPNTPYFVVMYFAALRIGAVVVNFNPLYVERELRHQILDSGTTIMIVPDLAMIHSKVAAIAEECALECIIVCPFADVLPPLKSLLFRLFKRKDVARIPQDARHISFAALIARDAAPDPVQQSPDDLAVLQYTGGTTGVPKGPMLTHANLAANSAQMVAHVGHWPAPPGAHARRAADVPCVRANDRAQLFDRDGGRDGAAAALRDEAIPADRAAH